MTELFTMPVMRTDLLEMVMLTGTIWMVYQQTRN